MGVTIQNATQGEPIPAFEDIVNWAQQALCHRPSNGEITVRVVGEQEAQQLNSHWRNGERATNVLAFPLAGPEAAPHLLGDVVVCAAVANAEATRGGKDLHAHWAHLVIHGTLHLMGYDHLNGQEAREMEAVERRILHDLGYPDPYE